MFEDGALDISSVIYFKFRAGVIVFLIKYRILDIMLVCALLLSYVIAKELTDKYS